MKTLLGQDAKIPQLSSALFFKDRRGYMNSIGSNTAHFERNKIVGNSKMLDMEGPLSHDFFKWIGIY